MANICEVTIKFVCKDADNTHTRTFTSFEGDWTMAHEMSREYAKKHFKQDDLLHMVHLNHASYIMSDLDN